MRRAYPSSVDGIALVLVLWVLTILMTIVLSYSYMARTETLATVSFRQSVQERFIAEAGVERAIIELFYRKTNPADTEHIWRVDCTPYEVKTRNGYATVSLTDESAKVDINKASDVILRNLLLNLGVDEERVDIIVDSIMDWRDPDDFHRLHGAESDYYMSLPQPYKAKNANFDSIEELLLVRGVDRELLYGGKGHRGIIDFLTVYSESGKINLKTAPREVLQSIPGVTPEMADTIISWRQEEGINIQQALGQNYSLISRYVTLADSNTFTIDSEAHTDRGHGYSIRATVRLYGVNKYKYLYYMSPLRLNRGGGEQESDGVE
jgi:general secretion pathway protein K